MISVVTGAAGFIGFHLCRRLLREGFEVRGVDSLTDFYPRWIKEKNLELLLRDKNFSFLCEDLADCDPKRILEGAGCVFHLAAQAGVRSSWGQSFSAYVRNNIQVTQQLLEAVKDRPLEKFVYASSSSVYGLSPDLPMTESSPLHPLSPYGVTKLSAEQLCFLYHKNYGVPTVSLRFFTVYGPGQRPDMAFHKFFKALAEGKAISVYGDGTQTRDFTYIEDIIEASVSAFRRGRPGETYNIGGGHQEKLETLLPLLEEICQRPAKITRLEPQKGDVPHTLADIRKARRELGYSPGTPLPRGLREEWNWLRALYSLENK
jgi:UDP-glucose 4-epimerase